MKTTTYALITLAGCLCLSSCDSGEKKRLSPEEQLAELGITETQYNEQLLIESADGTVKVIRLLLEAGADIHTTDANGRTPLHLAHAAGRTRIINFLINEGADENRKDKNGHTPQQLAEQQKENKNQGTHNHITQPESPIPHLAAHGSANELRQALAAGHSPHATAPDTWPPILHSSLHGRTEATRILLQAGANANTRDKDNWTPLHASAFYEHLENMQLLIDNGAEVNARDKFGRTPLHDAARRKAVRASELLLKSGADPNIACNAGKTPLDYASQTNDPAIINLLSAATNTPVPAGKLPPAAARATTRQELQLLDAAAHNKLADVKQLIAEGTNVNITSQLGLTPLMLAAKNSCVETALYLLGHDANPFLTDPAGKSAADMATKDIRKAMLTDIKPSAILKSVRPAEALEIPLIHACVTHNTDQVRKLIANGANVNEVTQRGWTPLMFAARFGNCETVQLLIKAGARINITDVDGWTPLHASIWLRKTETTRLLLEAGAKANAKDKFGRTPLHDAARRNAAECISLLLAKGAHINETDSSGRTPLQWAQRWNGVESIKLLTNAAATR